MLILMIFAAVHWGRVGNAQLLENWAAGLARGGTSPAQILKQLYYGVSLGMLGLTGFECTLVRFQTSHDGLALLSQPS